VQVRALGPTPVKGLSAPLDVFELIGAATVRTRLQAARARGFSRFVGRDAEMDQLREASVQARQGRGQLVAIVGDAGVGKSRLLYEFIHSHHVAGSGERGWRVLEARSLAYGVGTPFLPLAELLRGYFGLDERDDARGVRAKVTGTLFTLDRALEDLVAPLLWILDALDAVDPFLALEPAQRRRRAVESVKRALLRESLAQPLLLVFEDLQWADTETQAVLDSLVESLATSPILLTVNYRPEYRHGWGGKSFYRQLRIDPLPPARADELLRALLGRDPSTAALVPLLITRTEGNPLFLEESVRTLAETGALAGEPGAYRLASPADTIRMPSTVQAILEARIDRLRPELKRLLQAAAVVGKDVPLPLLAAVAEMPEDELAPALRELQGAEFLYEARLFPDVEYTFKHALTHEVAYESVLHERRRALHATILGALERLHAGRAGEHVEMLAHHAVRGGLAAKAIGYLREAGARAVARSANREAIGFLNQALALVGDAPRTRETLSQALDIRIALGPPLIAVHGPRSAIVEETYLAARELVDPLDDPVRRFIVLWGLWFVRFTRGDYAPAVESGERLIEIARAGDDSGRLIEAHHTLWPTLFAMGRAREALAHAERGVALYDRERHADLVSQYAGHDSGVCCRYYRAASLWVLGYPDRALTGVYEATSLAESLKHVLTAAMSLWFAGLILYERGDRRAAVATVQRAQALMSADPFPAWSADFDVLLDAAHATTPDIARLEVLYDRLQRMGSTSFRQAIGVCLLAQRAAQAGAPERGLAMLAALDRPERESLYEPEVSRTEGELLRLQRTGCHGRRRALLHVGARGRTPARAEDARAPGRHQPGAPVAGHRPGGRRGALPRRGPWPIRRGLRYARSPRGPRAPRRASEIAGRSGIVGRPPWRPPSLRPAPSPAGLTPAARGPAPPAGHAGGAG
jgi:tetratricopeptide (TPR) repeat protein